ncbi:hypothetical protein PMZ80_003685 [Knufia obscura]|uniref:Major facilitator superfamily (MFS) profile domain-containing protein n=1 Tax=Knufia obscura TaxID=1635080 RepID=A0ABR0RVY8_9EURO|nr:hypothetical protein PMZ80_003685 [Knufia obscura]
MGNDADSGVITTVDYNGQSSRPLDSDEVASTRGLTRTISGRLSTRSQVKFKVYKRRYFGLFQLVLLNIVVSWDWIALAPVSSTAATYFNTTESVINWLSTAFLFAFVVATPLTFWALSKHGPKTSIVISACFLLVGNWIKYAGAKSNTFGVVMFGQLIIGFAQPFVLAAPTTYSDLWFSPAGRTAATALASLSNPFGAALGQLISPFWVSEPSDIRNSVLWVSIIASVAALPSFFIPRKPPTPPAPNMETLLAADHPSAKSIKHDLQVLAKSIEFWLVFIPFAVYVGFFNAFSSLLNQILEPHGFSEDDAGIAGAVLIVVGLVTSAITSPLNDKYKFYLWFIRAAVPMIAVMYLIFIFAPPTSSIPYVYVVCALLGAASFGLVPVVLEFLVEILHPTSPSVSSSLCWSGGQLLGGIFIVIMDALKAGDQGSPPGNMHRALIFQAVIAMIVMPLPLCLGLFGRKGMVRLKRWENEQTSATERERDPDVLNRESYDTLEA